MKKVKDGGSKDGGHSLCMLIRPTDTRSRSWWSQSCGRSNESDGGLHLVVIKVHFDQSKITDMCVVEVKPDLSLEEEASSKTFRMRLTAVRVDGKKEAVDADETVSMNANIMKEDIEKYAELIEIYTSPPSPGSSWPGACWPWF